ncbi:hypothetical protein Agub_g2825, partial [Astrephomene gubernaculifera]
MTDQDGGDPLELHCPICYSDDNDLGYATLVCGHVFHTRCLTTALKSKKECPTCRCPAKPVDSVRRDAPNPTHTRCPCKTGQPIKLYHLQKPKSDSEGAAAAFSASAAGGGTAGAAAVALLAAAQEAAQRAQQREGRMREALQEERRRVAELEAEVARQAEEVVRAEEAAERRKERLAVKER